MTAWILALIVSLAPPGMTPWRESEAAELERYTEIATDIEAVAGNAREGALLVAIAYHESGFRLDVDSLATRGDGGRACGLWQLQAACGTRREQAAEALRKARQSMRACRARPFRDRLAAYASGSCDRGIPESRALVDSWQRLVR